MSEVRSSELVVDGVRTRTLEAGPAEPREAVVFVHGNPGDAGYWRDLVGRVGEFARAFALDMPGFGQADKPRDFDYSVAGYGRYLGGALRAAGIERSHLVLHDFGGGFGLAWAAEHPDEFASLVAMNTGIASKPPDHIYARIWRTPLLGELVQATATRPVFHRAVNRFEPEPLPTAFLDRLFENYDWGTRRAILKLYRSFDAPLELAATALEIFRQINIPVLIVWGTQDVALESMREDLIGNLRAAFPGARVELLEGSGHFPFIDDPEGVSAIAVPFLRQQVEAA